MGRKFIDCLGGFGVYNMGIRHPKIIQAVEAQLRRMPLSSQELLDPLRGFLAELLGELAPGDLQECFFISNGTDAVEGALKLARLYTKKTGFMIASQDEWIKAAYFDPNGGGKYSYWDYPTNPGLYVNCKVDKEGCASGQQPNPTQLDANGDVTNASQQPLASFEALPGQAPDWCPSQFTATQCNTSPFPNSPVPYIGNVSSVGQAASRSPWGTLDQGGNVVEVTDTISPPPALGDTTITWRRWHGGVVTATAYQMWLSAVGATPQRVPGYSVQPWRGIRMVVQGR